MIHISAMQSWLLGRKVFPHPTPCWPNLLSCPSPFKDANSWEIIISLSQTVPSPSFRCAVENTVRKILYASVPFASRSNKTVAKNKKKILNSAQCFESDKYHIIRLGWINVAAAAAAAKADCSWRCCSCPVHFSSNRRRLRFRCCCLFPWAACEIYTPVECCFASRRAGRFLGIVVAACCTARAPQAA